mgnify:CR=1 FL=1
MFVIKYNLITTNNYNYMNEGSKEGVPGTQMRTAEVIVEQQEAVGKLSGIDNELSLIKAMLDKWGEPADKEYLSQARQALSTLHHRLQDTARPR